MGTKTLCFSRGGVGVIVGVEVIANLCFDMKMEKIMTMTFLRIVILTIVFFMGGCAAQYGNLPGPSTLNLDYKVVPKNTNLIRAFDNQKETLLQFSDIEGAAPVITGKSKKHLKYSKVGQYIVVPGIHNTLHVKTKTGSFLVVRFTAQKQN